MSNTTELCSQCLPKHARFAQDQLCEACPDGAMTSFIFFLAVLLAVGLFSFLVWDNLDGAKDMIPEESARRRKISAEKEKKRTKNHLIAAPIIGATTFRSKMPFHSIVIRIISSYLQVAGMLQRFDLTLPSSVRTLVVIEASSSSLSEQLLLFDCGSEARDGEAVFLLKQVMSLWAIPSVSVLLCALFWMAVGIVRRRRKKMQSDGHLHVVKTFDGFISSLMVLFYTLFPSVVSRVALTFSCRSFGDPHRGTSRLLLNEALSVQCLKESHWTMMLTLGFPVVLLYIFIIPGFIAWTLIRQRKGGKLFAHQKHYDARFTIRFGFMFAGYREGYEFWECVVMLRKCAFVLLSVFLRQYGASPQVVAASIVLFLATSAHLLHRPYADSKHNKVESIGLHACQLQLLITLLSNMIGRVDRLVPQSPIGPVSTIIVVVCVFASTAHFFSVAIYWTVKRSQGVAGAVGNIARCCGGRGLCKAMEVEEEEALKKKKHNKGKKNGAEVRRATARGAGRSGMIKFSLRDSAMVAVHLERGERAAEEYVVTSKSFQRKLNKQKSRSHARLQQRLQSRSRLGTTVGATASAQQPAKAKTSAALPRKVEEKNRASERLRDRIRLRPRIGTTVGATVSAQQPAKAVTSAALQRKVEEKNRAIERLQDRIRLRPRIGTTVGAAASAQRPATESVSAKGTKGKPETTMTREKTSKRLQKQLAARIAKMGKDSGRPLTTLKGGEKKKVAPIRMSAKGTKGTF